jgi:hypothetical protein
MAISSWFKKILKKSIYFLLLCNFYLKQKKVSWFYLEEDNGPVKLSCNGCQHFQYSVSIFSQVIWPHLVIAKLKDDSNINDFKNITIKRF